MAQTLLELGTNIARETKTDIPLSIIGNTSDVARELLSAIRRTTKEIYRALDWEVIQFDNEFSSVVSQESYDLPSDFGRITDDTFWNKTTRRKVLGVTTASEWRFLKDSQVNPPLGVNKYYRIKQNKIFLLSIPSSIESYVFEYISNNIILDTDGITKYTDWQADTDTSLLDSDLIELGGTWRFLKTMGKDYSEAQQEYKDALANIVSSDSGRRTIQHGRNGVTFGYTAFPQNVPSA